MRKLLIICPFFPPTAASGAHRMLGFARHLPKFGWEVAVVTCSPVWSEPQDPGLAALIPAQTSVMYVDYPRGRLVNLFGSAMARRGISDNYWIWCRSAMEPCNYVVCNGQPDVILTSGPPHSVHLIGRKLKRRFGVPWVADFRDPWISEHQHSRGGQRFKRRWEAAVIRDADAVIANAPRALAALERSYPQSKAKMACITNGYDPETIPTRTRDAANGCVELMHAGELYAGRDPRPLLDAICTLRAKSTSQPACHITFAGATEWSDVNLGKEIELRECGDAVTIAGHLPYEAAKQRMVDADILVLLDSAGRRNGVPAKVYEYIGCKRPILALAEDDGDTAWVLRTSGIAHRIAAPNDTEAICRALFELLSMDRSQAQALPRQNDTDTFTREATVQQLAAAFEVVAEKSSRGKVIALARDSGPYVKQ